MTSKDSRTGGLALRYATAVFELAAEERAIDSLAADLASLKALLQTSPELSRLVRSPLFSREDQAKGMQAVLEKIPLDAATNAVLLGQPSVLRPAFQLMLAHESGEWEAAAALSEGLRLDADDVAACYWQAQQWARELSMEL